MLRSTLVCFILASSSVNAFAPANHVATRHSVGGSELAAMDRREALGLAFAGLVAAAVPGAASAANNPALQTFRGKVKSNSFYPGKGMRAHEENLVAANNPALQTFRGKVKSNSFYPGKGMRAHEENLVAANNPALQTFRGKVKSNSFYPGKGMRAHEENLVAANNPALQTFRGKVKSNSFYPGKGMRDHVTFEDLMG